MSKRAPLFDLAGTSVAPGRRKHIEIPVSKLPMGSTLSFPVTVLNGTTSGPRVWLSAAIHGDELNGVEIVRRIVHRVDPKSLKGVIVAAPTVNVFGMLNGERYLPDRRDLNRSFPGSKRGSLAARLAHIVMETVVGDSSVGIDFHTGSHHRDNHPQVRGDLDDPTTHVLAHAFAAPLLIDSSTRDGSLRQAAVDRGASVLVFEGGEPLRLDKNSIKVGIDGALRVLHHLGMISESPRKPRAASVELRSTRWVRARRGGLMRVLVEPGEKVDEGQTVANIADVTGSRVGVVRSPITGFVVGVNRNPLVNRGDAVCHLGSP